MALVKIETGSKDCDECGQPAVWYWRTVAGPVYVCNECKDK